VNLFVIHLLGDAISPPLIGAISDRSNLRFGLTLTLLGMVASAAVLFYGMRFAPPRAGEKQAALAGAST
jgi:Na+/melibiose symporter-like transporter